MVQSLDRLLNGIEQSLVWRAMRVVHPATDAYLVKVVIPSRLALVEVLQLARSQHIIQVVDDVACLE
jgi:hypothetical protein